MTGIIIRREYVERIKSKSFIIGTGLVVLSIIGLSFLPLAVRALGSNFTSKLVGVAPNAAVASAVKDAVADDYDVVISKERSIGPGLPQDLTSDIKAKKYDAALVAYQTPNGLAFTFYPRQANLLQNVANLRHRLVPVVVNADLSGPSAMAAKRALNF